ncbi:MAG: right-handed parallel beta-helix repeat-containing protein [Candidatus Thorarchaeota archaeon]
MIKNWQLVLLILVLIVLSSSPVGNIAPPISGIIAAATNQDQLISSYAPHSPIIINSNLDFESQGWPGNGTQSNPFIIEGLSIVTDGKECINISHTDVFFVIRDCYISSVKEWEGLYNRGVTFGDVTNGIIERVVISKKWLAITIFSSSNCSIIECEIYDSCLAIDINGCYGEDYPEHCRVFNNTIYENKEGIHLYHVSHCEIDRNNIVGDICLQETVECIVSNNRIDGSQATFWSYYLCFYEAVNTIVVNNTMVNSGLEFDILYNPSLQLYNNTVNGKPIGYFTSLSDSIINPSDYGQIILIDCNNVTVRDGTISNTARSISFYSCNECVIDNCTIYSCGFGATLCGSDHCSIIFSDFHDNKQWGIAITESSNTIVTRNIVYENQGKGVFVPPMGSYGNAIYHNMICSNGKGFTISDGNSWDDSQNNVWDDGLSLGNFWDDYTGTGNYRIPGDALSVDRYPSRADSVSESGLWVGFNINPSEPTENDTVIVSVGVIDIDGVDEVILSYSTDGNLTWTNVTMVQLGPIWNTTLPPQSKNTTVTYRVLVRDSVGNFELSNIQSYSIPSYSNTNTTEGLNENNISISIAIAVGGTLTVVALVLLLSRRRY